jgi:cell division protein FtsB
MRYWGTEDNVSRSGKPAGRSRRKAGRARKDERRPKASRRAASGQGAQRQTVTSGGGVKDYPFLRQFYRHQTQLSERLQKVLFALLVAALIYVFILGDSGAIKILQLRLERSRLDSDIVQLQQSVVQLEKSIERLEDDYGYIEKIARERYGYVRPGDRVYKMVPIDDGDF